MRRFARTAARCEHVGATVNCDDRPVHEQASSRHASCCYLAIDRQRLQIGIVKGIVGKPFLYTRLFRLRALGLDVLFGYLNQKFGLPVFGRTIIPAHLLHFVIEASDANAHIR